MNKVPIELRQLAAADLSEALTAPPRQQRSRDRQQALIEAGMQLTATKDWANVSVGEIAAMIGCSVGTFYTRFHSKEAYFDVLLGLVADWLQQSSDAFYAAPKRQAESPEDFIKSWVRLTLNSYVMHRGLYAASVLRTRQLTAGSEAIAVSPLLLLRDRGRKQFFDAMIRRPGWRTVAAQRRLTFAPQLLQGVLVNAALTDPGPLRLDDPALQAELVEALCAYLRL